MALENTAEGGMEWIQLPLWKVQWWSLIIYKQIATIQFQQQSA
jgi:hypothetical protein